MKHILFFFVFLVICGLSLAINTNQYFGSGGVVTNTSNFSVYYGVGQITIGNNTEGNSSLLLGIFYIGITNTTFSVCGDAVCNGVENCTTCPADCGVCVFCGDLTCNGLENCTTCPGDCGVCPSCPDGVCNGGETCVTCAVDCGICPSGGGGQSGIDNVTFEEVVNETIYNVYCNRNISFPLRLISRCEIVNGVCDDGEDFLFDSDCQVDLALVQSGELFQQMWFLRYFLILSIFLLFRSSKQYPLIISIILVLFIYNNAFVKPGYLLDPMKCTDLNFFFNAGYCVVPTHPIFGWVIMISVVVLLLTYFVLVKGKIINRNSKSQSI